MGGVHVAEEIDLDRSVDRDDAESADHFRVVRDFLRTQADVFFVELQIRINFLEQVRAYCERGSRDEFAFSFSFCVEGCPLPSSFPLYWLSCFCQMYH